MAAIVLTDSQLYVDDHDMTCDANQAMMNANAEAKLANTFCSGGWDEYLKGVKSADLSVSGLWQTGADSIDATEWAASGNTGRVVTFVPPGATEGGAAYMLQTVRTSYDFLGPHGEIAPFNFTAQGSEADGMVRGRLLLTKTASISSTGAVGTAVQVGAVAADEFLYLVVHLFPTAGTSITIAAESDATNSFSGSETSRANTGSLTTAGGTWVTKVAGPITDTWWRLNVSAVVGSWTAAGAVASQ